MTKRSSRVSYSTLSKFRSCPRAWQFGSIERLQKVSTEPAIDRDFGSWWHALRAADSIVRGRQFDSLKSVPETLGTPDDNLNIPTDGITEETVYAAAGKWWNTLNSETKDAWLERYGKPVHEYMRDLDRRYRERWKEEREHEVPLGVEIKILTPLATRNDSTIGFVGYVDEVYFDRARNMTIARDHKTHRALNAAYSTDDMMDSQNHLYGWGISKIVASWGYTLNATAYDRVRANPPKFPQVTSTGNLSKSVTDYDLGTYLDFVGEGVPWGEEGVYYKTGAKAGQPKFGIYHLEDKVIENLQTPDALGVWHHRSVTPLNRNVVMAHIKSAVSTASSMADVEEKIIEEGEGSEAPRNLTRQGCKWCDFQTLCRAMMFGGPNGYYPPEEYGLAVRPDRPEGLLEQLEEPDKEQGL